ncbi:2-iminoacetate synthase ThiH [Desulfopila sp. IMCC35008]|uniref:2-iminoacetate synthase ThiH n=1 Tax=Desulfopila sp. IMCC35008 TaxID=2653858 RepID=UPI0013D89E0A|nr:2-iminoacetate synthase ThiH [Desulfopila sp. IMCC35008]
MSFSKVLEQYRDFSYRRFFDGVSNADIQSIINKSALTPLDFLALLSPRASNHLEPMAEKARQLTIQYFGRTIQLFSPLYISNHCSNHCVYCGFNCQNGINRRKLAVDEIAREAETIAASGIQHVLLLTGEAPQVTPVSYLVEAVTCLKKYFASVSIEIFPMEEEEYQQLEQAGVDGLTLFQEVYDPVVYKKVHLAGRKRDYRFRLDGPERGARAGFRMVNIGTLLGLGEPRSEFFLTGLHAAYLDDTFLDTEISVSLPRFNEAECDYRPDYPVDDKTFVQFLLALRLFQPRAGITISTRENAYMRDNLMQIGATRFSAGVSTSVGGYSLAGRDDTPQFEITDERDVAEMAQAITAGGYQPVYKDWDRSI